MLTTDESREGSCGALTRAMKREETGEAVLSTSIRFAVGVPASWTVRLLLSSLCSQSLKTSCLGCGEQIKVIRIVFSRNYGIRQRKWARLLQPRRTSSTFEAMVGRGGSTCCSASQIGVSPPPPTPMLSFGDPCYNQVCLSPELDWCQRRQHPGATLHSSRSK